MQERKELTYLKAFSSLLVVFHHTIIFSELYYYSNAYYILLRVLDRIHVPLFILLAGYLCHKQPLGTFYKKKGKRLLIPFLFMSSLKLLFTWGISSEFAHGNTLGEQLKDAFINGQLYWFCYCLLLFYLISPLLWNRIRIKWILLILSVAAASFAYAFDWPLTNVLQLGQALYMFPLYLIGMLLAEYQGPNKDGLYKRSLLLLSLGIALAGSVLRFVLFINRSYCLDLLLSLSYGYLLYLAAGRIKGKWIGKIGSTMGGYSLQIMFLEGFFRIFLFSVLGGRIPNGLFLILLVCLLSTGLCCLCCCLLERVPVLSLLLGLSGKKPSFLGKEKPEGS